MASNVFQNVHPHFNPEEAAHTAVEFVASLDNLPGEVTFLLEEISEKDKKINGLMNRINTRHYGLTKSIKSLSTASSGSFPLPIPPGAPLPLDHLSTKDQQAMQKINTEWIKVEQLQLEKIRLATRLEAVTSRARERGRAEWTKVGGMDLEEIEGKAGGGAGLGMGMGFGGVGVGELGGGEVVLPPGGLGSGSDSRPYKKRKPNALPLPLPPSSSHTIHPPPSSMMPPPPRPGLSARGTSRHNRQISTSTLSEDPDADADGEVAGEAEGEGDGDGDEATDDTLYCFCQQKSYGEMIGCDNEECEFEWFHLKCVSLSSIPADTWYCPVCVDKLGLSSSDGTRAGQQKKASGRKSRG